MPPGPIGKRDAERRRRNKPDRETTTVDVAALIAQPVEIPAADPDWHPVARMWYESLPKSGQAVFYEPSDWATAFVLAETLDRELKPKEIKVGEIDTRTEVGQTEDGTPLWVEGKDYLFEEKIVTISAASVGALLKGMTALMVTEGDRRRAKAEIDRTNAAHKSGQKTGTGGNVSSIADARQNRFQREPQK